MRGEIAALKLKVESLEMERDESSVHHELHALRGQIAICNSLVNEAPEAELAVNNGDLHRFAPIVRDLDVGFSVSQLLENFDF